jgi:hypothetical protein
LIALECSNNQGFEKGRMSHVFAVLKKASFHPIPPLSTRMDSDKIIKIAGLLIVTVSVPTAASLLILDQLPTLTHLFLYVCVALAAIHPALGLPSLPQKLELIPESAPKPEQKSSQIETPKVNIPVFTQPDIYIDQLQALRRQMIECTDLVKQPANNEEESLWRVLLTQKKGDFTCEVHKRVGTEFFFRVIVDFEATKEEMFDLVADIEKRPSWDEITVASGIVERISNKTSVQFLQSKGFWPTAARDALVVSFIEKLEDGRLMNVTKSVDSHKDYTSNVGDVRMIAKITGIIAQSHPSGNPKLSRCIQVIDGDLCGWLPSSLVSMISTQAFPISMRRANSQLKKIQDHRTVSTLIEMSEGRFENQEVEKPKGVVVAKPSGKQSTLEFVVKLVNKTQPWAVLAILLLIIFKRNKQ